jgi:Tol biopolymer transport system component
MERGPEEASQRLAVGLDFSPLIGPASQDGRYLILLKPLEPGGIPYVLERATGRTWPLLQGHPHQAEISGWAYAWHPNNRQVLFWAFNAEALWLVHAETGEVRVLAVTQGVVQGAALSPDGLSVVYINPGPESARAVWRVSTAGGDAQVLFDIGGPARVYSFSPDGKALLYAAPEGPLWLMDPAGENRRPLAGAHVFGGALAPPAWSPDSRWVAYTGLASGNTYGCTAVQDPDWESCRYEGTVVTIENITTGEIRKLTAGIEPVWLRDGSGLVFLSNRTGVGEVWLVDPAGGTPLQLTKDGTSKGQLKVLPAGG